MADLYLQTNGIFNLIGFNDAEQEYCFHFYGMFLKEGQNLCFQTLAKAIYIGKGQQNPPNTWKYSNYKWESKFELGSQKMTGFYGCKAERIEQQHKQVEFQLIEQNNQIYKFLFAWDQLKSAQLSSKLKFIPFYLAKFEISSNLKRCQEVAYLEHYFSGSLEGYTFESKYGVTSDQLIHYLNNEKPLEGKKYLGINTKQQEFQQNGTPRQLNIQVDLGTKCLSSVEYSIKKQIPNFKIQEAKFYKYIYKTNINEGSYYSYIVEIEVALFEFQHKKYLITYYYEMTAVYRDSEGRTTEKRVFKELW